MAETISVTPQDVEFVQTRELIAARDAIKAMRDCLDHEREIGLPVLPETRKAIDELEGMISSLKLELLHSPHPDQMMLPGMEVLSPEEGSHRGDMAS